MNHEGKHDLENIGDGHSYYAGMSHMGGGSISRERVLQGVATDQADTNYRWIMILTEFHFNLLLARKIENPLF